MVEAGFSYGYSGPQLADIVDCKRRLGLGAGSPLPSPVASNSQLRVMPIGRRKAGITLTSTQYSASEKLDHAALNINSFVVLKEMFVVTLWGVWKGAVTSVLYYFPSIEARRK